MLGDSMYLENIEEYVQDENRIVTYKWLSRTLSVPVNAAKRMLYEYVEKKRSSRNDSVSVIYLVSGLKDGQDGLKRQEVTLVEDNYLEEAKNQFSSLWTIHVYSIQRTMPKDCETLYAADHQCNKEHLSCYHRWNTIGCPVEERATSRKPSMHADRDSPEASLPTASLTTQGERQRTQGKVSRQIFPASKTTKKKPPPAGDMTCFLSKAKSSSGHIGSLESTSTTYSKSIPVVPPVQKVTVSPKESPRKPAQPITKQSPTKHTKPDKSPSKSVFKLFKGPNASDKEDGEEEVDSNPAPAKQQQQNEDQPKRETAVKSGGPRRRQTKRERDNAKNDSTKKSEGSQKRRRVRCNFSDDESDQETDVKPAEESSTRALHVSEGVTGKKRKRVKKLVSKMFMDEDGAMVTEKHWEDVSTDASSDGEGDAGAATQTASPIKTVFHESKTTATHHLPSKGTKQSSLMSFFGK